MTLEFLIADLEEVGVFSKLVDHGADVGAPALWAAAFCAEAIEGVATVNAEGVFACRDALLDCGEYQRDCAPDGKNPHLEFAAQTVHHDARHDNRQDGPADCDAEARQQDQPLPAKSLGDFSRAGPPEWNIRTLKHCHKVRREAVLHARSHVGGRRMNNRRVGEVRLWHALSVEGHSLVGFSRGLEYKGTNE